MSDPPRRGPGRPPLPAREIPARVHVSLAPRAYDQAYKMARREGISVPEVLRRGLTRELEARDRLKF